MLLRQLYKVSCIRFPDVHVRGNCLQICKRFLQLQLHAAAKIEHSQPALCSVVTYVAGLCMMHFLTSSLNSGCRSAVLIPSMGRAPGGIDHVSALLHARTPPSKQDLKAAYAAELRAQMAAQQATKRREEDEYHSRSPRRDALSDFNAAPGRVQVQHFDNHWRSLLSPEQQADLDQRIPARGYAEPVHADAGSYGNAPMRENDPAHAQRTQPSAYEQPRGIQPASSQYGADSHYAHEPPAASLSQYQQPPQYQQPLPQQQNTHHTAPLQPRQPQHPGYHAGGYPPDHSPAISPDPPRAQWQSYQSADAAQPRRTVAFDVPQYQPSAQHDPDHQRQQYDHVDWPDQYQTASYGAPSHAAPPGSGGLETYSSYRARSAAPQAQSPGDEVRGRPRQRESTRPEETVGVLAYLSDKPDVAAQERKKQAYRCGVFKCTDEAEGALHDG